MKHEYLGVIVYNNTLTEFEEKSTNRYVRDGLIIISEENEFFTVPFWPTIEEIKCFSYKNDKRISLLTRNFFDYLLELGKQGVSFKECLDATDQERAKPKKLSHVTYTSDITNLEIPFNETLKGFILYSQTRNGEHIFTANLGFLNEGKILMTAPKEKVGLVNMTHHTGSLEQLLEIHKGTIKSMKIEQSFINHEHLCELGRTCFDNIIRYSEHALPI
ncbi:MAG: hypothetical protein QW404_01995 [Candidatus Nanoarchaeia archaeon]